MKNSDKKIYITVIRAGEFCKVGTVLALAKDKDNQYDDEAIIAYEVEPNIDYSSEEPRMTDEQTDRICQEIAMYVANSVSTVARGTYSAGRLYDKFGSKAFAKVKYLLKDSAICEIIELC